MTSERSKIRWFYDDDDKPLENNDNGHEIVSNDKVSVLTLKNLGMALTGRYSCSVENRAGVDRKTVDVNIKGEV